MFDGFYIDTKEGNNALSYEERKSKKLYVPKLIDWTIEDAEIWNKIVFEDFSFENDELVSCKGLKNYLRIPYMDKEIILVDNHNTVLYFWYEARKNGLISNDATLIHIDEHSDLWKNDNVLSPSDSRDLEKVFDFTNYKCNVWNYILPAEKEWLIWKTYQIRSEFSLLEHKELDIDWDIILNVDLDFWNPNLDFIDYNLKKEITLKYAKKAKIITVSTSPFFIDQELALKVFRDLFK